MKYKFTTLALAAALSPLSALPAFKLRRFDDDDYFKARVAEKKKSFKQQAKNPLSRLDQSRNSKGGFR